MRISTKRKHVSAALLLIFSVAIVIQLIYLHSINVEQSKDNIHFRRVWMTELLNGKGKTIATFKTSEENEFKLNDTSTQASFKPKPNYKLHAFYYAWYGTPEIDHKWLHWNHRFIKYWKESEANRWPSGMRHNPPQDLGASFYPKLGPYSSRSNAVIEDHMRQLIQANIGVISLSWYPPGEADEEGQPADQLTPVILDVAQKYQIKVCFHVEPFKNRDATSLLEAVKFAIRTFGSHPAVYKVQRSPHTEQLPVFYMYDSYQVSMVEWMKLLTPNGAMSLRKTRYDAIFIGLVVDARHKQEVLRAGFDGFYTYFSSDSFTYGSASRNWKALSDFAMDNNLLFSPSVGPGYDDTRIRPWNSGNTKRRQQGLYYKQMFREALKSNPRFISITSFNEWGEGTQIEEAVPKTYDGLKYEDYFPEPPDYYLRLTKIFSDLYK